MITTRKKGRIAAVSAVIAGLVLGTALTASADPVEGPPEEEIRLATIDPEREGSITITKLRNPGEIPGDLGGQPLGSEIPNDQAWLNEAVPISGVKFSAQKVAGVDLTTQEGWEQAAAVTTDFIKDEGTLPNLTGVVREAKTGADGWPWGVAKFEDLELGLYLVQEVSAPADVVMSTKPFLVTIPMTDPDDLDRWMYDVHVYPKNETVSMEKSVVDNAVARVGDVITYEVSMTIPERTQSFVVTDELDPRLEFVEDSMGYPDFPGTHHYDEGSRVLTVMFEEDSTSEFMPPGVLSFTFKVRVMAGNGSHTTDEIINTASYVLDVNGRPVTGETDPAVTKWGGAEVVKLGQIPVDPIGPVEPRTEPLAGAVFNLYSVRYQFDDYGNRLEDNAGNLIEVQEKIGDRIVSDANGRVEVDGLRYSRFADGVEIDDMQEGFVFYRLVEVEAPKGYELLAAPIDFEVADRGDSGVIEIVNYLQNAGFPLPEIGGNRAVLPILAAVVAAGGVVFLIRSRRQQEQKA